VEMKNLAGDVPLSNCSRCAPRNKMQTIKKIYGKICTPCHTKKGPGRAI